MMVTNAYASTIGPNDFYDEGASYLAAYYLYGLSQYHKISGGFHSDVKDFVLEAGTAINSNEWETSHQSLSLIHI